MPDRYQDGQGFGLIQIFQVFFFLINKLPFLAFLLQDESPHGKGLSGRQERGLFEIGSTAY
jgi:hypothetical protein